MNNPLTIPNFVQELLEESNKGLDQVVRKLSEVLSYPVLVIDPFYQVLSYSVDFDNTTEIIVMPDLLPVENSQYLTYHCQISINDAINEGLASPITVNNKKLGYLIFYGKGKPYDDVYYEQVLHCSASLCALQIQKKRELRREKSKFKEAFLFDLLYGNIKEKEDIIEHGDLWGWDFTAPQIVVVFSFLDYDYFFTDKNMFNSLLHLVEMELINQNINPIAMVKQNQLITIIPLHNFKEDQNQTWLSQFVKNIFILAGNLHPKIKIACGLGKAYINPSELYRSYQEAKVAYELGILLKIDIPFFSNLGLEKILYRHDLQDVKEHFENTVGPLLEYDENHDGNLLETLDTLSSNQFDMGKTSDALFIHRNTLRYRTQKIEKILNVKLDDLNVRLNIIAAFKIKLLRKI